MKCPTCGSEESAVIKSDSEADLVRRRRQCGTCGFRWSTVEASAADWKYRKSVLTLANALARAVSNPGRIDEDPSGTRLTITIDPVYPIGPRNGGG